MALKVIQWASGGVGRAAVAGIVAHPDLELVGLWVHDPGKVGRDAGELAGIDPLGVAATDDVDALLALGADCVLYSPIMADEDVVARILASGASVVTPLGWFYAGTRDVGALEEAARAGGATLHGTGIHPGGITERFPLMVSALSGSVTHVRAEEFSDIRTYGAPDVVRHIMLFGATPEEAAAEPDGRLPRLGLPPVHRHGRRRPRVPGRRRAAHRPRGGGGDPARSTRPSAPSSPAWWRPSASRGRPPSTASRS